MRKTKKYILVSISVFSLIMFSQCGPPGTVSVGVGVGVGGPWVGGPYGPPGGTVWVGRPIGPVYYYQEPLEDSGTEFVKNVYQEEFVKE